jgi:hypothetical protein
VACARQSEVVCLSRRCVLDHGACPWRRRDPRTPPRRARAPSVEADVANVVVICTPARRLALHTDVEIGAAIFYDKKFSASRRQCLIAEKCLLYLAALLHSHTFIA